MEREMNIGSRIEDEVIASGRGFDCDICDQPDLVPSTITLEANYGSKHDGTRVTLNVCGDCMDWIIDNIVEWAGKPKNFMHW